MKITLFNLNSSELFVIQIAVFYKLLQSWISTIGDTSSQSKVAALHPFFHRQFESAEFNNGFLNKHLKFLLR